MSTPSQISVTEGAGDKNLASYQISETTLKELQRIVMNASDGTELIGRLADALSLPVALSTEDVALLDQLIAVLGATGDAAVAAGATGSVSAKLRLVTTQLNTLAGYLDGVETSLAGVALESGGNLAAAVAVLGATGDAAVAAGATGSISAKLRLVTTQLNTLAGYLDNVETLLGGVALESGGNLAAAAAALGATTGAKVITDANGTLQQYLRGLIYLAINAIKVGGNTIVQAASSTITRPADTTAYASGDLIANSTTAGSVNALQFSTAARVSGGSGVVVGAQVQKSTNVVTNVAMRLHLFSVTPTFTSNGDNTAISTVVQASGKDYLGYIDITAFVGFSDVAWGSGAPDNSRGQIPFVASVQTLYGILEARSAFTPGNAEVFTVKIDVYQD